MPRPQIIERKNRLVMNSNQSGTLYIVATPIGNLGDMVPRAVEILQSVTAIACEDKRHSKKLLDHFAIDKPLFPYHDHSDKKISDSIIARLQSGDDIALISDAGTPLISDPGYRLVLAARVAGIRVIPVPGACAAIAALSVAGLPTDRFRFVGFLPAKTTQRKKVLQELMAVAETTVFYEAPHRILETLHDAVAIFGPQHSGFIAREVSKTFETYLHGTLSELVTAVENDSNQQRGEIVLVLAGRETLDNSVTVDGEKILRLLLAELPAAKAAALTAKITGGDKKQFYQLALALKD